MDAGLHLKGIEAQSQCKKASDCIDYCDKKGCENAKCSNGECKCICNEVLKPSTYGCQSDKDCIDWQCSSEFHSPPRCNLLHNNCVCSSFN